MWNKIKPYAVSILLTLAVGGLSALLTMGSMESYEQLVKPSFAPPAWIFPVVWTALFILMGAAMGKVWATGSPERDIALILYAVQLTVNFFWTIIFFNFGALLFAFFWLLLLIVLVVITFVKFRQISPAAAYMLIPYILWLLFAAVLNLSVYLLNK